MEQNQGTTTPADDVKLLESEDSREPITVEDKIDDLRARFEQKKTEKQTKKEVKVSEDPVKDEEDTPESDDEPEENLESDEIPEELKEYLEAEEEYKPKDEILPHERPTYAEIKKEFPTFFKKFPALRDMLFRETQYSELFPTVGEAREAQESLSTFNELQNDVFSGTGKTFIQALKDADSLERFAPQFLKNIEASDQNLHWKLISPILQKAVRAAYASGKKSGNENLLHSAEHIADFLFDDSGYATGEKEFKEPEIKDDPLKNEREAFNRQKYNDFRISVTEKAYNDSKALLEHAFREVPNKLIKEGLVEKALREINRQIEADKVHMTYLSSLWKKVSSSNYSNEIKSRILTASLARVKSLIPTVTRRLMSEAKIVSQSEIKRRQEVVAKQTSRREPGGSGKVPDGRMKVPSAKAVDWSKTSDADFLSDRITLKK